MSTFSSYPLLSQEKIHVGERLSALRGAMMYGAANALFELLAGTPPPGAQGMLFHPHDHARYGVSLPRASVYSFAMNTEAANWVVIMTNATTWYHFDRGVGGVAGILHDDNNDGLEAPDIMAYITQGIDSNNTAVSASPCALEAKIVLKASAGTTTLRIHNRNTNTQSSEVSTATSGSVVRMATITDIPCVGGDWNAFDIETKTTSAGATATILDINIAETRTNSQPQSGGSASLTATTKP